MKHIYMTVLLSLTAGLACTQNPGMPSIKPNKSGTGPGGNGGDSVLALCGGTSEVAYTGFGGRTLGAGRVEMGEIPMLADRFRVKPYEVLEAEFQRVVNLVPESLTQASNTFAAAPDRWYMEPQATSVTLFTTYKIAYEASLKMVEASTEYNAAPTQDSAKKACTEFAAKAWNRAPSPDEVASCTSVAMEATAQETNSNIRWAHAFASVLTASGFIAY